MRPYLTAATLGLAALGATALAADHGEAPGTKADPPADINDLYVFHAGGKLTTILSFDPLLTTSEQVTYDPDLLYTIHIDVDGDNAADTEIYVRFGQNKKGEWGMQVQNLPGASGDVEGAIETPLSSGSAMAWVGRADDPFFFDLQGYLDTLSTGQIKFTGNDFFARYNVGIIALQMDIATFAGSDTTFQVWATSARLP